MKGISVKLGFYYHLPIKNENGVFYCAAYLGVFIDSIAENVDSLTLFMHSASDTNSSECEYVIRSSNIQFYDLGVKTPAWQRFINPLRTLKKMREVATICDVILVRAPSPLAPQFCKVFGFKTKIVYLIVGNYLDGIKDLVQPFLRKAAIRLLSIRNDLQLSRSVRSCLTLVNSAALFNRYQGKAKALYLVRTTTLSNEDFYYRSGTCGGNIIYLLYTGRIDIAKGLRELVEATALLRRANYCVHLNIVGWEDYPNKPVENLLKKQISNLGLTDFVTFHGRKKLGEELNLMYRNSDIYILPSYHEGFPRTIWEAMANGLPVIASRVGSIPAFIGHAAEMINPKDPEEIFRAVKSLIENPERIGQMLKSGYKLALDNTLEKRGSEIVNIIRNEMVSES